MPILGDLNTMSLADLLRWAGTNAKTGVLELERNKLCRRVEFRKGWIGACSSSDPASRLGQFLLSRGKITEEQLTEALARQQTVRKNLGWILNEMNVLGRKELARLIGLKAEETMYGLFEWERAVFRYSDGATLDPDHIEVSISIEDILVRGRQRIADLQQIRADFDSSGIVLERVAGTESNPHLQRPMARRIFESIDGERTLGELLLHANAAEFTVLKFLYQLHRKGFVTIKERRALPGSARTLLDRELTVVRHVPWGGVDLESFDEPPEPHESPVTADVEVTLTEGPGTPDEELDFEVQVAQRLVARGECEAALELLNAVYRARPDDDYLRRLLAKTEGDYVEHLRQQPLSFTGVPVRLEDAANRGDALRPEESFLLDLVDGRSDIQSMLWVTPMREIDVLVGLRRLLDRGLIAIPEADASRTERPAP